MLSCFEADSENMVGMQLFLAILLMVVIIGGAVGQKLFDERCQQGTNGEDTQVDQCDSSKLLTCMDGLCQCADPKNQIYRPWSEHVSGRHRRSTKSKGKNKKGDSSENNNDRSGGNNNGHGGRGNGGLVKKVIGIVSGGSFGFSALQPVGKTVVKTFKDNVSPENDQDQSTYSCFSRIGSHCLLHGLRKPSASNAFAQVDITKIPRCIEHAVCKPLRLSSAGSSNRTSGLSQKTNGDPRFGTCKCKPGYKATGRDLCVEVDEYDATEENDVTDEDYGTDKMGGADETHLPDNVSGNGNTVRADNSMRTFNFVILIILFSII